MTSLLLSGLAGRRGIGASKLDMRRFQCQSGGEIRILHRRIEMPIGKLDLITGLVRVLGINRSGHAWQPIRDADPYLRLHVGVRDSYNVRNGIADHVGLADDEGGRESL